MRLFSPAMLDLLNEFGASCGDFAVAMLFETAILFAIIGILDLILLRRLRTVVRYAAWSLVLFKLMLPTALPGPLSLLGIDDDAWAQSAARLVPTPARTALRDWTQYLSDAAEQESAAMPDDQLPQLVESPAALPFVDADDGLPVFSESASFARWPVWLLLCWLCGVVLLTGLLMLRLVQVRRLIRASTLADPELQALFLEVQRQLQAGRNRVRLRISRQISSPAIGGLWTPTILIPRTLPAVLSRDQMRLVLIHELIHWRRGDLLWNCVQSLLQIVYFYNPCVWFTNSLLRRLREYRVDEETVILSGSSSGQYAETLLEVATLARLNWSVPAMSLGVFESRSILSLRVRRMLTRGLPSSTRLGWCGFLATGLLAAVLLPLSGCHRMIGIFVDPDLAATNQWFELNQMTEDPRVIEARRDMMDGVADKMLQREELRERKLADSGLVEQRLTDAGIAEIAADEVVGIVVDTNLQPIAGATVRDDGARPVEILMTDDQGIFRLQGLGSEDSLRLVISKAGYSPRIIMRPSTGQKNLLVILGDQTRLEGVVTGPDNKPVKGARVLASCGPFEYTRGHRSRPYPFETTSGDDGRYRLDVCSSKFDVKVSAPGVGVFRQAGVVVSPNQSVSLPIQLETGIHFEAIVVDSQTGQPYEGFVLYTTFEPCVSARSDAQGRLVLKDLFPGMIEFHCGAGERLMNGEIAYWQHGPLGRWWSPDAIELGQRYYLQPSFETSRKPSLLWQYNNGFLTFDLRPEMKPVMIVVEQGVAVSGVVTDPAGQPVAGATVSAVLTGRGQAPAGGLSVVTDDEGRYQSVLPASQKHKYNMAAHDGEHHETRNWANGISVPLQTTPGQVIQHVDLKLTAPGTIRGRITSRGKPMANRAVYTRSVDGCDNPHHDPQGITAADGTFELKFVRPGKQYLLAEPRYSPPESDPKGFRIVDVRSGEVSESVNLEIKGQ